MLALVVESPKLLDYIVRSLRARGTHVRAEIQGGLPCILLLGAREHALETGMLGTRTMLVELAPSRTPRPTTYRDLLRGLLSERELKLLPRAYDMFGGVIVLELPPPLIPKAELIGKALLRFHAGVRAVYLRAGVVGGDYRVRPLKLIAGEPVDVTQHSEYGVTLVIMPERVYYSPRLAWEHRRVALQVRDGEWVVDMFTGVGPFALHIACERRALVYAVDWNPYAIRCLRRALSLNARRLRGVVIPVNADVRVVARCLRGIADRVIMNLPERAHEFLIEASSLLKPGGGIIHFYTFESEPDELERAIDKLEEGLRRAGRPLLKVLTVRHVKEVAPRKWHIVVDALVGPSTQGSS